MGCFRQFFEEMLLEESKLNDPEYWMNEGISFVEIPDAETLTEDGDEVENPMEADAGKRYHMVDSVNHPEEGVVIVKNDYKRRAMLRQGWQDALKIDKEDPDGKYSRNEIDPRDFEKYEGQGWRRGWKNYKIIKPGEKAKYIKPDKLNDYLKAGWHEYIPVRIHKKIQGKKGENFQLSWVDQSELEQYEKEGWGAGWDMPEEAKLKFSIQTTNEKLGNVCNFSLTPVKSCPSGIPCAKDGCYALQCYRQYPLAQQAWDHNLELLKQPDGPERLVRDVVAFLSKRRPRKSKDGEDATANGTRVERFRWHVAGDLINRQHLEAIGKIAELCPNVQFWLYTKNYEIVSGFTPPSNLVVILSAWNDFKIKLLDGDDETHSGKGGLHKNFPVAYMDDWIHKDLIPKDEDAFICPCADDKVGDMIDDKHCATCKTHSERHGVTGTHPCYMLKPGESVIFRKH